MIKKLKKKSINKKKKNQIKVINIVLKIKAIGIDGIKRNSAFSYPSLLCALI